MCAACGCAETTLRLRLIRSGRGVPYPKYLPQIKECCAVCGAYVRFAPQTDELVARINARLEAVDFAPEEVAA
jgi:hypothetical protein